MSLEINIELPEAPELIFRPKRATAESLTPKPPKFGGHLARAFWRGVPHWDVPPAFEDAGKAYSLLGEEAYKAAVYEYYQQIGATGLERAQRTHSRWAVRQVLRTFETHIRGYRRQSVGARGGIFHTASDQLVHPQKLWDDGQLVADLEGIIVRYQVRSDLREATVRLARQRLKSMWGLT
jgi:hypothetical protein